MGLLEYFSSGVVRLADNSPSIDLSHVIFIITSNIPINVDSYSEASTFQKKEICHNALEKVCGNPEIAEKITNCIAFQRLPIDTLTDIVRKFVVEELMVQLKEQHSNYGARGGKDAVREVLTTVTVYDRNIGRYKGAGKVKLLGNIKNIKITVASE